ncbi:hypothetical protein K7432_011952 [Basidiobolus ranarum]|uniref:N-acetyltransferase domain-containing protein n=1 Tax=Basidiobolus ranarum TaxID=34480 RepID=A0ABR2WLJ8_9FUNG
MKQLRIATQRDIELLLYIARETQTSLQAAGSLQEIGIHNRNEVEAYIDKEYMYIFEDQEIFGGVKIEPLEPGKAKEWRLNPEFRYIFLSNLMLLPKHQRKGLGVDLMGLIFDQFYQEEVVLVLDCWEGNKKLREFYQKKCHFILHGVFPQEDYEIAVFRKELNK